MLVRKLVPLGALLALAACGGSTSAANSLRPTPSPQRFRNGASGQLVKITGTTLILSGSNGDTTVVYTAATRFSRTSAAALGDIVPGLCLIATGQKDASGAVTAATVRLSTPLNGSCVPERAGSPTPGAGGFFGGGGGANRPRPTPPPNFGFAAGMVTAVSGTQITLSPLAGGASSVTVPTTVAVSKTVSATAADLQIGECLAAAGRRDASGTVQAVSITITPPNASGTCATRGFGGFFGRAGGGGGFFGGGGAAQGAGG